jgi:LPS export ABC transporter protein LptC
MSVSARATWVLAAAAAIALARGAAATDVADLPQQLDLTQLTYVDSEGKRRGVVLKAEEARVMPRTEQVVLRAVALQLATADDRGRLELSCEHGQLDLQKGDFVGVGRVRGSTPDGRRFETERLHYDHEAGLVTTDAPVVIRDKSGTLRGGGFLYQVREGRLKLTGGATVVGDQ